MNATLQRISDSGTETLGIFTVIKPDGSLFTAHSLERPWRDNLPEVSCIPVGEYKCVYTRSNRLSKLTGREYYTYEVLDVPDRSGIRIHSANYFNQLLGCIALGNDLKDINFDGQQDIVHSGLTVKEMERLMNYEPFKLTIHQAA